VFSPDRAPRCEAGARVVHWLVSASRAVPDCGPRAATSRRLVVEAHVSTEQPQALEDPWFSYPYAHAWRTSSAPHPPRPRAQAALGLIWHVRDRATFEALARAPRRRAGPVSLRFLSDGSDRPPRVAYAVGRHAGIAVARNRIRRRLRAAVAQHAPQLCPGGAYLVGADRSAMTLDFAILAAHVGTLVRAAGEGP
jgi:ribonuclease P protein component